MAGVSTKEIKNRIRSMESTKQITKAMEMVASSKLRKAQNQALAARPYFEILYETICRIASNQGTSDSVYLTGRPVRKTAWVVIAGDRGLAGGYNSNVLKAVTAMAEGQDAGFLPVGKKALDFFKSRGLPLLSQSYADAEDISIGDCFTLAKDLCRRYRAGELDEIRLIYTKFISVLSQEPHTLVLLPLPRQGEGSGKGETLYEPSQEEVFQAIVPEYLGGVLYGALCESRASEQAARRNAMDAATQNADEMIADLSLQFNRARQAAITQEITEIVAGAQDT